VPYLNLSNTYCRLSEAAYSQTHPLSRGHSVTENDPVTRQILSLISLDRRIDTWMTVQFNDDVRTADNI